MNRMSGADSVFFRSVLLATIVVGSGGLAAAQSNSTSSKTTTASTPVLEREFFAVIREGDTKTFLSYVPEAGVNLGPQAEHVTRSDVEQQLLGHHGIYCKLFDSSCIDAPINLDNSARACSYRELLTHSEKVSTAASEITRSGVRQAVLVARIKNDQCSGPKLIDFIFNFDAGAWKLFSIP